MVKSEATTQCTSTKLVKCFLLFIYLFLWKLPLPRPEPLHSFLYKNFVYKKVEAEIWVKIKNNIRTLPNLNSQNHKNCIYQKLKKEIIWTFSKVNISVMVWFNIIYSQNDRPDLYKWMDMPNFFVVEWNSFRGKIEIFYVRTSF